MDELEFYNGQLTGAEIDRRIIYVNCGVLTGTGQTITATVDNNNITAKHYVIGQVWGVGSVQVGALTVETSNGQLTITGIINGSTQLWLILGLAI